jgi:uncharacterized glyoxalase superfamily protein PhnB
VPVVLAAHYARFVCPEGRSTFSVHRSDQPIAATTASSTVVYFECDDLDLTVKQLEAAGLVFDTQPADQTWLWREARLRDPDGNPICLFYAGRNRIDPPWRVDADSNDASRLA